MVWAVYLATRRPCIADSHSMHNMIYETARQMFMLRASGSATLELLQAGLLITYYACGHGLPRDAHMTLATCLTLARLMGFDFEEMKDRASPDDQHSVCRWAIVLLDRYVLRPLICDPVMNYPLERWHYQVSTIRCR